ncbi:MAG: hypothetical protein R6V58_16845, partial [Planctomycetota bacterium]
LPHRCGGLWPVGQAFLPARPLRGAAGAQAARKSSVVVLEIISKGRISRGTGILPVNTHGLEGRTILR